MKGKCYYCKKEFSKTGMLNHLKSCGAVKEYTGAGDDKRKKITDNFILAISPRYSASEFWLFILIDKIATLKQLDQFLRDVWLECCGHLSSFKINGQRYENEVEDFGGWGNPLKSMNVKIKNIIRLNDKIDYEYDFGSTTHLEIKVVGEQQSDKRKKKIEIMARNDVHSFSCSLCDSRAEYYHYEKEDYLCSECVDEEDEMVAEVGDGNSPRSGVCGYQGSTEDEIDYLPELSKTDGNVIDFKKVKYDEEEDELVFTDKEIKMLRGAFEGLSNSVISSSIRKEAKKWGAMSKIFSLSYHLSRLTKNELLDIAKNLYIDRVSSLKKDEIKDRILELYENRANYVLENMDIERFEFLLNLVEHKGYHEIINSRGNNFDYYREKGFIFTGNINLIDTIIMPEELQRIVLNRNNDQFKKYLKENDELIRLFWGMCYYYGVIELHEFKRLVMQYIGYDISSRNLKHLLHDGANYHGEFDFSGYFGNDILVEDFANIIGEHHKRNNLDYYPLKKIDILKVTQLDYRDNSKPVQKLRNFLVSNYNIEEDEADDLIFELDADIKNDKPFNEVVTEFLESFDIKSVTEANLITDEVSEFANNTRHWVLKGYTPEELRPKLQPIIKDVKVGRNDPCPCGSGKKYKKCCGDK